MYLISNFLNKVFQNKLIRLLIISGLNVVFGYGLFALLIFIGVIYPIALLIATFAGILFNFKTIGGFVFKNHNNLLIFKFFGVYGVTYLCNLGGLTLLKYIGMNAYLSGALLLIPIGILSFTLNKVFVFTSSSTIKKGRS